MDAELGCREVLFRRQKQGWRNSHCFNDWLKTMKPKRKTFELDKKGLRWFAVDHHFLSDAWRKQI